MLTLPLLYHELRPEPSRYSYVTACSRFRQHLELFQRIAQSPGILHPEITFDDGHLSNIEHALPILTDHAVAAHFFITVGWTGTRTGYMDWHHLRTLQASGQQIGSHGWTHTLLTHLKGEPLDRELRGARQTLEDRLGTPITTMSLPGGRFNQAVLHACTAAGYTEVWTSIPRAEPFPFHSVLGRLNIRGDATDAWLEDLLQPQTGVLRRLERQHRIKDAAKSLLGDRLYARLWSLANRQEPDDREPGNQEPEVPA